MNKKRLRTQKRYDYSDSGAKLRRGPLDLYSLAREPHRESDESSDQASSSNESDSSSTIVHHENNLEDLSDLSEDLRNLSVNMDNEASTLKMFASQESLHEDINDFIDENPINS